MENYKIQKPLGDGTYGSVFKATNIKTGEVVAIKKFKRKYPSWDECMQLREIKALRKLSHPNIIKLKEVLKVQDELNLVFEFLDRNVFEVYMDYKKKNERIPENTIRSIIRQVLEGLAYMHKHGYFHRDLKPENLLMYGETVKICDFGLAREVRSRPPYTDYVATRWYRAPEILLKQNNYNSPVDIFALGCIMAELYNLAPLFDGKSEIDQIIKICNVLGTPNSQNWPDAQRLASQAGITFPQTEPQSLGKLIPTCSSEALVIIQEMLRYDPQQRPSAQQLLSYPFFTNGMGPSTSILPSTQFKNSDKKHEERVNFGRLGDKLTDTRTNFFDPLASNHFQQKKDEKNFRDSTQNFLEFLDKKLNEDEKRDKKKESGTKEKFHIKNDDAIEKEYEEIANKRNNPFKILKYNDPIANGGSNSMGHHYDGLNRQQKPIQQMHGNQYSQSTQFQIPHLTSLPRHQRGEPSPNTYANANRQPSLNPYTKLPLPYSYQNRISQNYGRVGETVLGKQQSYIQRSKEQQI